MRVAGQCKYIWILWLQGWENAPTLVKRCLASWQYHNPSWNIIALDWQSLRLYIDIPDLSGKQITPASFSDLARVTLLHDYGGLWVDATLLCTRPLDDWLTELLIEDFFVFRQNFFKRPLSSWFIYSKPSHYLTAAWLSKAERFWSCNHEAHNYFWFHELFEDLCNEDPQANVHWSRVPNVSAYGPHLAQHFGLDSEDLQHLRALDEFFAPVVKLTHRIDESLLQRSCLVNWLTRRYLAIDISGLSGSRDSYFAGRFGCLSVSTNNLGDHIQILSAVKLVKRLWEYPLVTIDRDCELASPPMDFEVDESLPIVMNGWFKHGGDQWPPHPCLSPAYVGFHIRLFQCPELLSQSAIKHYKQYGAIGCRDQWTCDLLQSHGVDAYVSHCLSLTTPRRRLGKTEPADVFVVSRDSRILSLLPSSLDPVVFVSHYTKTRDFWLNMIAAERLLETYKCRARLVVTTLLHCALPAMAMGIPVVMISPLNTAQGSMSDRERFSSLASMIPIYSFDDLSGVDWNPPAYDCSREKITALASFYEATKKWGIPPTPLAWELASPDLLQPPSS